jgi:hypothetical protein
MTINSSEASSEANKKSYSLNLTDELIRDKIVTSFDFHYRDNSFDIILELNDYYHKKKFVFSIDKGWDLFIRSTGIQLKLHRIERSHIFHILDTMYRNCEKLEDYHREKYFDSFYESLLDELNNSESENSDELLTSDPNYHLIKEFIVDLIARNYTFLKDKMAYNTILDQHDRKIDPIIIKSEHIQGSKRIKFIINKYDTGTQQAIFRKIVKDEYRRDLGNCKLEIDWDVDDDGEIKDRTFNSY